MTFIFEKRLFGPPTVVLKLVRYKNFIFRNSSFSNFPKIKGLYHNFKNLSLFTFFKDLAPFAVVGSNTIIDQVGSKGRQIRGRKYAWGVVDIENEDHCDFLPLRNMLVTSLKLQKIFNFLLNN